MCQCKVGPGRSCPTLSHLLSHTMNVTPQTQLFLVLISADLYWAATLPHPPAEPQLPVSDLYYHARPQVGVNGGPQPQILRNGKPQQSVNSAVKSNNGRCILNIINNLSNINSRKNLPVLF